MQGGIDSGGHENPMTAAVRELKEETGISSARIVALVRRSPSHVQHCASLPSPAGAAGLAFTVTSELAPDIPGRMCSRNHCMQLDEWLDYDFPTDIRSHMTGSWTRYRGQTQKW